MIEDHRPDIVRNEYASSLPIVEELRGKSIGYIADLRGPSVQQQQEQIVEIQSKYVRLFQDVIEHFQERFPQAGTIQSIHVGDGDRFDPTVLIESLKRRRQHVEQAMAFYSENPCTFHLLASQLGLNLYQLMTELASNDEWFIRCVECSPAAFSELVETGIAAKKIVLELSGIVTIARLGGWDKLDRKANYILSRATADVVAEWLHSLTEKETAPAGYSCLTDDGQLYFHEAPPELRQRERDAVQIIQEELRSLCTVQTSQAIAAIEPGTAENTSTCLDIIHWTLFLSRKKKARHCGQTICASR